MLSVLLAWSESIHSWGNLCTIFQHYFTQCQITLCCVSPHFCLIFKTSDGNSSSFQQNLILIPDFLIKGIFHHLFKISKEQTHRPHSLLPWAMLVILVSSTLIFIFQFQLLISRISNMLSSSEFTSDLAVSTALHVSQSPILSSFSFIIRLLKKAVFCSSFISSFLRLL